MGTKEIEDFKGSGPLEQRKLKILKVAGLGFEGVSAANFNRATNASARMIVFCIVLYLIG